MGAAVVDVLDDFIGGSIVFPGAEGGEEGGGVGLRGEDVPLAEEPLEDLGDEGFKVLRVGEWDGGHGLGGGGSVV